MTMQLVLCFHRLKFILQVDTYMFCQADHHPKLQLPGSKAFASTSKRSMQASGSGMLFYDHWGKGSNINEVSKSSFPSRWISLEDNCQLKYSARCNWDAKPLPLSIVFCACRNLKKTDFFQYLTSPALRALPRTDLTSP